MTILISQCCNNCIPCTQKKRIKGYYDLTQSVERFEKTKNLQDLYTTEIIWRGLLVNYSSPIVVLRQIL